MISGNAQKNNKRSGSPDKGEPVFLIIGKIRRPHGVKGEVLFETRTTFPERIKPGIRVYISEKKTTFTIESVRPQKENLLVKFKEISDCDEAGIYRNQMVYVQAKGLPALVEDEFYFHELIGLEVRTERGEWLGQVDEIIETGANEVLVVKGEGKEHLFPFLKDVVLNVNLDKKEIIVRLLEWK